LKKLEFEFFEPPRIRVRLPHQTGNPIDDERDAVGHCQGEHEDDQPADYGFRNADFIQVALDEIARNEKMLSSRTRG